MATLTVEDGTGLAAANAYVSEADFDTYWADRTTDPVYTAASLGSATSTQKTEAILVTTQELDAENNALWKGYRKTRTQGRDWPRSDGYDNDGYAIDDASLPQALVDLTCERAARYIANITTGIIPDLTAPVGGLEAERLKAGPVEIDTKFSGSASQSKGFPKLDVLLQELIEFDGSIIQRA